MGEKIGILVIFRVHSIIVGMIMIHSRVNYNDLLLLSITT